MKFDKLLVRPTKREGEGESERERARARARARDLAII